MATGSSPCDRLVWSQPLERAPPIAGGSDWKVSDLMRLPDLMKPLSEPSVSECVSSGSSHADGLGALRRAVRVGSSPQFLATRVTHAGVFLLK